MSDELARPVPIEIRKFVWLAAISIALGILKIPFMPSPELPYARMSFQFLSIVISCAIAAYFVYMIWKGRNWARITVLFFFLISLDNNLHEPIALFYYSALGSLLSAVQLAIHFYGMFLIFSKPGSLWFNKKNFATNSELSTPSINGSSIYERIVTSLKDFFLTIFIAMLILAIFNMPLTGMALLELESRLASSLFDDKDYDPDCEKKPLPSFPDHLKIDGILFMNYKDDTARERTWLPFLTLVHDLVNCENCDNRYENERPVFSFQEIAGALLKTKLQFLEIQAPPKDARHDTLKFLEFGGTENSPYLKFSISKAGDPACKASEKFQKSFDIVGLEEGQCVASQVESTPKSQYAIEFEDSPKKRFFRSPDDALKMWKIVNINTQSVYTQLLVKENASIGCITWQGREKFWEQIYSIELP